MAHENQHWPAQVLLSMQQHMDTFQSESSNDVCELESDGGTNLASFYSGDEIAALESLKKIHASIHAIRSRLPYTSQNFGQTDIFRLHQNLLSSYNLVPKPKITLYKPLTSTLKANALGQAEDERLASLDLFKHHVVDFKAFFFAQFRSDALFKGAIHRLEKDLLLLECKFTGHYFEKTNPNFQHSGAFFRFTKLDKNAASLGQQKCGPKTKKGVVLPQNLNPMIAEYAFFNPNKPPVTVKMLYEEPTTQNWAASSNDSIQIPFLRVLQSHLLGAILMLDPVYRLSNYDPKEHMVFDPVHTSSPKECMQNTVLYLRPLSKSRIGRKLPEFKEFNGLTDYEVFEVVRDWVDWMDGVTIGPRAIKDEDKHTYQLVARFLGLPAEYQEALGAAPAVKDVPVVKAARAAKASSSGKAALSVDLPSHLKSKLGRARKDAPTQMSLPIRTDRVRGRHDRVQKAVCVRKPSQFRDRQ